jgi:NAD(P)H-dependent nitrite reductase small subunit
MIIKKEKEFIRICSFNELKENEGRRFLIEEVDVAVFRLGNQVYALGNVCPHQKSAIIYDGLLEDGKVICPAHGWEFRLKDGNQPTGSKGLDSFEVKIKEGDVYVKVFEKELDW